MHFLRFNLITIIVIILRGGGARTLNLVLRKPQVLTALQEVRGLVQNILSQLTSAFQVVQDEDVGSKQEHVLLPATVRHGQELVQVLCCPAHQVTCPSKPRKSYRDVSPGKLKFTKQQNH